MRPPLPVRRSAQRSWSTCRCSHVAAAPCADHGRGCMATRALSDPACCKAACAGRLELHCDARCCPCSCSASLLLTPSPLESCCCQRRERSKLSVALWTCAFPCVPVAAAALVVRRAAGGRRKRCCRSSRRSSGRNARAAPVPLVTAGASLWRRPLRCSCASCHRRRSLRGWRRRVIRCRVRRSRRLLGIFLCWRGLHHRLPRAFACQRRRCLRRHRSCRRARSLHGRRTTSAAVGATAAFSATSAAPALLAAFAPAAAVACRVSGRLHAASDGAWAHTAACTRGPVWWATCNRSVPGNVGGCSSPALLRPGRCTGGAQRRRRASRAFTLLQLLVYRLGRGWLCASSPPPPRWPASPPPSSRPPLLCGV